jgi:hypothetical protein
MFCLLGSDKWKKASVTPLISDTALRLVSSQEWSQWEAEGRITERQATVLTRTLVLNPYPYAQINGLS